MDIKKLQQLSEQAGVLSDTALNINDMFAGIGSSHLPKTQAVLPGAAYLAKHHAVGIHTVTEPITAFNWCGSSRAVNGLLPGMDSVYLPTTQAVASGVVYLTENHKAAIHTGAISALDRVSSAYLTENHTVGIHTGAISAFDRVGVAYLAEHHAVGIHTGAISAFDPSGTTRSINDMFTGIGSACLPTTQAVLPGAAYLAKHHAVGIKTGVGAISAFDRVGAAYLPTTQAVLPGATYQAEQNLSEAQQQQLLKSLLKELKAKGFDRQPQLQLIIEQFTVTVEVYMGDSIKVGNDSTLINRSTLTNSLNQVSNENKQAVIAFSLEVTRLLEQLHSTNPEATEPDQARYIDIATPPALKQRVISALKEGTDTAIDEFILENKYLKVAKSVVKGWLEPGG